MVLVTALAAAAFSSLGAYAVFSNLNQDVAVPAVIKPFTTPAPTPSEDTSSSSGNLAQVVSLTQSQAIVRAVGLVKPSVVTITTTGTANVGRFNNSVPFSGSGSGFIASSGGLILTNNHVISGATTISVVLDSGKTLSATVVSTDSTHDLALLKITASTTLPALLLGDSSGVQLGQEVVAMGNPLGTFADSVSQGIVSGLNRSITVGDASSNASEDLTGLIQTDAAINPGNSGGPMFDLNGQVVGVIVASSSNAAGIGFAVPINAAKAMIAAAAGK